MNNQTMQKTIWNSISFLFLFGLLLRLFYYVFEYSVNIPYWDQWDYFNTIFREESYWNSFLYIHAPHRQGIGFVIDRFFLELYNLDTRTSSVLIVFTFLFSCIIAMRINFIAFDGRFPAHNILIFLIFLSIGFYESILIVPNPSHGAFPLFLITSWCFTLMERIRFGKKILLLLVINLLSIYTGFAIFAGLISISNFFLLAIAFRKEGKFLFAYIISLIFSLLFLFSFFYKYKFFSASECFQFPHSAPIEYIHYLVLSNAFFLGFNQNYEIGLLFWLVKLITLVFVLYKLFILSFRCERRQYFFYLGIFSLMSFSLLFELNSAIGRVCFGIYSGQASRYMPYQIPSFFGMLLLFFKLTPFTFVKKEFLIIPLFLFLFFTEFFKKNNVSELDRLKRSKMEWVNCYLKSRNLDNCQKQFQIYPDSNLIIEKLKIMEAKKWSFFYQKE